jgi:hypothetical protein
MCGPVQQNDLVKPSISVSVAVTDTNNATVAKETPAEKMVRRWEAEEAKEKSALPNDVKEATSPEEMKEKKKRGKLESPKEQYKEKSESSSDVVVVPAPIYVTMESELQSMLNEPELVSPEAMDEDAAKVKKDKKKKKHIRSSSQNAEKYSSSTELASVVEEEEEEATTREKKEKIKVSSRNSSDSSPVAPKVTSPTERGQATRFNGGLPSMPDQPKQPGSFAGGPSNALGSPDSSRPNRLHLQSAGSPTRRPSAVPLLSPSGMYYAQDYPSSFLPSFYSQNFPFSQVSGARFADPPASCHPARPRVRAMCPRH